MEVDVDSLYTKPDKNDKSIQIDIEESEPENADDLYSIPGSVKGVQGSDTDSLASELYAKPRSNSKGTQVMTRRPSTDLYDDVSPPEKVKDETRAKVKRSNNRDKSLKRSKVKPRENNKAKEKPKPRKRNNIKGSDVDDLDDGKDQTIVKKLSPDEKDNEITDPPLSPEVARKVQKGPKPPDKPTSGKGKVKNKVNKKDPKPPPQPSPSPPPTPPPPAIVIESESGSGGSDSESSSSDFDPDMDQARKKSIASMVSLGEMTYEPETVSDDAGPSPRRRK